MHSLTYHAYEDSKNKSLNKCNRRSDERPLIVNCTGTIFTSAELRTDNAETRVDYYLLYIVSGELTVHFPTKAATLGSGHFLIFPPGCRYKYFHNDGTTIEYMWLHFTGSHVEETLEKYELCIFPKVNKIEPDDAIVMRFQNIFNAFIKHDKFRENELSTLLERLMISLARRVSGEKKHSNLLNKSIAYINSSYVEDLRIPDLAKMENLSVSRYNTLFRQVTGISPVEYIKKMRLASACELLSATDLPIKTVSAMVGYADPHFFSRLFKKSLGVSPAFYRKNE